MLRVVHALVGVLFVGGLVGRWIVLGLAQRASSLGEMRTLLRAAMPFERIVVFGSAFVLILGIATAAAQGRPFLGPIQGAPVDWLFVALAIYLSIIPLVPLVFLPRGRMFEVALQEATDASTVTPALAAAWSDRVVRAAHLYELGAVTVVLVLMLAKPF